MRRTAGGLDDHVVDAGEDGVGVRNAVLGQEVAEVLRDLLAVLVVEPVGVADEEADLDVVGLDGPGVVLDVVVGPNGVEVGGRGGIVERPEGVGDELLHGLVLEVDDGAASK
ncbi:hypothetical protein ACWCPF_34650 [Streptomyces sp. NPDC001858]